MQCQPSHNKTRSEYYFCKTLPNQIYKTRPSRRLLMLICTGHRVGRIRLNDQADQASVQDREALALVQDRGALESVETYSH